MKQFGLLILLGVLFAGCTQFSQFSDDEYRGVWSNALSSFEVRSRGEVELSENGDEVVRISPGGRLILRERRFSRVRLLEVTGGPDGTPQYFYELDGRKAEFDSQARQWLTEMLLRVARETPIGASARAQRILRLNGPDALLDEVEDLNSNTSIQIYLEKLLESQSLQVPILERAAEIAARKISSSSRQRKALSALARVQPDASRLTVALMEAAENISSSSECRKTLVEIAESRPLDENSALAMARTIGRISSSSQQRSALEELARSAPASDTAFSAYLDAVTRISSSSEQRRAITALLDHQTLSPHAQAEAARAIRRISSNSEQMKALVNLAEVCSPELSVVRSYLDAVESISSSSSQGKALDALLERRNLSEEALGEILRMSRNISSKSVRRRIGEEIQKQLDAGPGR